MKTLVKTILSITVLTLSLTGFAQKKTQNFTISRIIEAPIDKVWKVVGEDFGAIANSHPAIVSSNYINGSLKGGEGAERICNLNEKGTKFIQEKQIEFNPEDYSFKVQIFHIEGVPMDPENSFAIYKLVPIDENSSKFVFTMTYRTKPAFMGAMAKGKFKNNIKDYTIAVEHHVLTGENVNKENFKMIKNKYKN